MTSSDVKELVERLKVGPDTSRDVSVHLRKYQSLCDEAASALTLLSEEREELRKAAMIGRDAALAIQKATLEGRVCDDVAWFSTIETLHDFCAHTIEHIDKAIARAALKDT